MSQTRHLHAEIEFWQEMIEGQKLRTSDNGLKRMQQALALAQWKLGLLEGSSADHQHPSVYWASTENH